MTVCLRVESDRPAAPSAAPTVARRRLRRSGPWSPRFPARNGPVSRNGSLPSTRTRPSSLTGCMEALLERAAHARARTSPPAPAATQAATAGPSTSVAKARRSVPWRSSASTTAGLSAGVPAVGESADSESRTGRTSASRARAIAAAGSTSSTPNRSRASQASDASSSASSCASSVVSVGRDGHSEAELAGRRARAGPGTAPRRGSARRSARRPDGVALREARPHRATRAAGSSAASPAVLAGRRRPSRARDEQARGAGARLGHVDVGVGAVAEHEGGLVARAPRRRWHAGRGRRRSAARHRAQRAQRGAARGHRSRPRRPPLLRAAKARARRAEHGPLIASRKPAARARPERLGR